MIIYSIVLNGLELADGTSYWFHFAGTWDFEKDVTTNDIFGDGTEFGRSKSKAKTLTLTGYVLGGEDAQTALNGALASNALKTLTINNTYTASVEVASRASTSDDSRIVTIGLTMPDPHWYALQADTLSLEPSITNGVIFGDVEDARVTLDAGESDGSARIVLDADNSDGSARTVLDAGGSD